jgi:hypothetical protein
MSSHEPIKVAAHVLRLGGALDDGNYDIALRQRSHLCRSAPHSGHGNDSRSGEFLGESFSNLKS